MDPEICRRHPEGVFPEDLAAAAAATTLVRPEQQQPMRQNDPLTSDKVRITVLIKCYSTVY